MNWEIIASIVIAFISGGALSEIIRQRNQRSVTQAQAEEVLSEAWERLAKEYARLLENARKMEIENAELRPLVLKLALQDKDMQQFKEDKEDWKRYARKLATQLEEASIIPIPFQRYPSSDSGKISSIMPNDKMVNQ